MIENEAYHRVEQVPYTQRLTLVEIERRVSAPSLRNHPLPRHQEDTLQLPEGD